jgi:hypothetical protein
MACVGLGRTRRPGPAHVWTHLGEDVGRRVVVAVDVVKLRALEVSLELAYLGTVGIHRILLDVARLIDLVDDDLGITVSDEPLDSQGNNDA